MSPEGRLSHEEGGACGRGQESVAATTRWEAPVVFLFGARNQHRAMEDFDEFPGMGRMGRRIPIKHMPPCLSTARWLIKNQGEKQPQLKEAVQKTYGCTAKAFQ